eukprot:1059169-Rhodomonas_salina.3
MPRRDLWGVEESPLKCKLLSSLHLPAVDETCLAGHKRPNRAGPGGGQRFRHILDACTDTRAEQQSKFSPRGICYRSDASTEPVLPVILGNPRASSSFSLQQTAQLTVEQSIGEAVCHHKACVRLELERIPAET